jgi:hypothetical protein
MKGRLRIHKGFVTMYGNFLPQPPTKTFLLPTPKISPDTQKTFQTQNYSE